LSKSSMEEELQFFFIVYLLGPGSSNLELSFFGGVFCGERIGVFLSTAPVGLGLGTLRICGPRDVIWKRCERNSTRVLLLKLELRS
jgi:hypothetical protein